MKITNKLYYKTIILTILCTLLFSVAWMLSIPTNIHGNSVYLLWLPLAIVMAAPLLWGQWAFIPLFIALVLSGNNFTSLSYLQSVLLASCIISPVGLLYLYQRNRGGKFWQHRLLSSPHMWAQLPAMAVIAGLFSFAGILISGLESPSVCTGSYSCQPGSAIVVILGCLGLVTSTATFTQPIYDILRLLSSSKRFIREIKICYQKFIRQPQKLYFAAWVIGLSFCLYLLFFTRTSAYIASYIVPLMFIIILSGVALLPLSWLRIVIAATYYLAMRYYDHYLHGSDYHYTLAILQSSFLFLTVCLYYIAQARRYHKIVAQRWQKVSLVTPITRLPNLRALESKMHHQSPGLFCCLFISNLELLGHHHGVATQEHVRGKVGERLRKKTFFPRGVFQLPGNHLLALADPGSSDKNILQIFEMLQSEVFLLDGEKINLDFSLAWSTTVPEIEDYQHLLGHLCWLSREASLTPQRFLSYDSRKDSITRETRRTLYLLNEITALLKLESIVLYVQPIVGKNGDVYAEVLTRLQGNSGLVMPDVYLPIIEKFGLYRTFDFLVITALFKSYKHHAGRRFSINLMSATLLYEDCAKQLIALFRQYAIPAEAIIIEITEDQFFSSSDTSYANINSLRDFGCTLAIDDFGKGYANYGRLKYLDVGIVKIDGSLVRNILTSPEDRIIIRAICDFAALKQQSVVAEFVETTEQQELLFSLGVNYAQGYLTGKPVPLEHCNETRP